MKRIILIIIVMAFVIILGCASAKDINNYAELEINKETINAIEKGGTEIIGSIGEYSYLSEKGKITGTYYLNQKEALVFVSRGKPNEPDQTNVEIYIDESKNATLFFQVGTVNGDEYIKTYPGEGYILELQDHDYKSIIMNSNGIIDINDSINIGNKDTIGYFSNTIFINGHIINSSDNGIYRETFYGNEETTLVNGYCNRLQYYSGRIYYVEDNKLFSISPDGADNKLISDNDVSDYIINDKGIMILSMYPDSIKLRLQEHGKSSIEEVFSAKGLSDDYRYSLIGFEGNKVYLSRRDITKSWIEILSQDGDGIKILIHKDTPVTFDYKPIINGDNILYIVRNGIHKYNIKENSDILVAKTLYTFGPILVD